MAINFFRAIIKNNAPEKSNLKKKTLKALRECLLKIKKTFTLHMKGEKCLHGKIYRISLSRRALKWTGKDKV